MGELLKRLEDYYAKQGISALDFHRPHYLSCKRGYNDSVEAKGTFVSSGYETNNKRGMDR
ncbi:MAG: hypothetical protein A2Y81_04295 [Nitrospirae bacterium RBG_13_43_8]|nr:MAG: hypothetical protein A2Y81_04295 [Nitrospirae bacterium RBG_13_43_8]